MLTRFAYVMIAIAVVFLIVGVVFASLSFAEINTRINLNDMGALMCQIACIPACAAIFAGVSSFDE